MTYEQCVLAAIRCSELYFEGMEYNFTGESRRRKSITEFGTREGWWMRFTSPEKWSSESTKKTRMVNFQTAAKHLINNPDQVAVDTCGFSLRLDNDALGFIHTDGSEFRLNIHDLRGNCWEIEE